MNVWFGSVVFVNPYNRDMAHIPFMRVTAEGAEDTIRWAVSEARKAHGKSLEGWIEGKHGFENADTPTIRQILFAFRGAVT